MAYGHSVPVAGTLPSKVAVGALPEAKDFRRWRNGLCAGFLEAARTIDIRLVKWFLESVSGGSRYADQWSAEANQSEDIGKLEALLYGTLMRVLGSAASSHAATVLQERVEHSRFGCGRELMSRFDDFFGHELEKLVELSAYAIQTDAAGVRTMNDLELYLAQFVRHTSVMHSAGQTVSAALARHQLALSAKRLQPVRPALAAWESTWALHEHLTPQQEVEKTEHLLRALQKSVRDWSSAQQKSSSSASSVAAVATKTQSGRAAQKSASSARGESAVVTQSDATSGTGAGAAKGQSTSGRRGRSAGRQQNRDPKSGRRASTPRPSAATPAQQVSDKWCDFCQRSTHNSDDCWFDPVSPSYGQGPRMGEGMAKPAKSSGRGSSAAVSAHQATQKGRAQASSVSAAENAASATSTDSFAQGLGQLLMQRVSAKLTEAASSSDVAATAAVETATAVPSSLPRARTVRAGSGSAKGSLSHREAMYMSVVASVVPPSVWLIDTCASLHIAGSDLDMPVKRGRKVLIRTALGLTASDQYIRCKMPALGTTLEMVVVQGSPNLLSVGRLIRAGFKWRWEDHDQPELLHPDGTSIPVVLLHHVPAIFMGSECDVAMIQRKANCVSCALVETVESVSTALVTEFMTLADEVASEFQSQSHQVLTTTVRGGRDGRLLFQVPCNSDDMAMMTQSQVKPRCRQRQTQPHLALPTSIDSSPDKRQMSTEQEPSGAPDVPDRFNPESPDQYRADTEGIPDSAGGVDFPDPEIRPAPATASDDQLGRPQFDLGRLPREVSEVPSSHFLTHLPKRLDCLHCSRGKLKRFPATRGRGDQLAHSETPYERLSLDLIGPTRPAICGSVYLLLGTDDCTGAPVIVKGLRSKTARHVTEITDEALRDLYPRVVKIVRTDHGSEFTSPSSVTPALRAKHPFEAMLRRRDIKHELSLTSRPTTNSRTERFHGTLNQGIRTIMAQSGAPYIFWLFAVTHWCFNYVRTSLQGFPPMWERLTGKRYPPRRLVPFGCAVTYLDSLPSDAPKFFPRTKLGSIIGYRPHRAFVIVDDADLASGRLRFIETRDVAIDDRSFPFHQPQIRAQRSIVFEEVVGTTGAEGLDDDIPEEELLYDPLVDLSRRQLHIRLDPMETSGEGDGFSLIPEGPGLAVQPFVHEFSDDDRSVSDSLPSTVLIERGVPDDLELPEEPDVELNAPDVLPAPEAILLASQTCPRESMSSVSSVYESAYVSRPVSLSSSLGQSSKADLRIQEEVEGLVQSGMWVWDDVKEWSQIRREDLKAQIVRGNMLLVQKHVDDEGTSSNEPDLKARLVALGNWVLGAHGNPVVEEDNLVAHNLSLSAGRVLDLLGAAYSLDGSIVIADIAQAYSQAELKGHPKWLNLPSRLLERITPVVPKSWPGWRMRCPVMRIRKAMYGLRRAGFDFSDHLHAQLAQQHFLQCPDIDPTVFWKDFPGEESSTQHRVMIGAYVDDIKVVGEKSQVQAALSEIQKCVTLKPASIHQIGRDGKKFLGVYQEARQTSNGRVLLVYDQ
ncbi:MAG: DDE-type integrase/transposase/recombinase, partial [bacterium]|nr:DDE-type integrase/transposase/recombinase [bacterium]